MFKKLKAVLGLDPIQNKLNELIAKVPAINELEPRFEKMTDAELSGQTAAFRARLDRGETLDDLLPEAFATVREVSKRVLGMRPYDVQLIGGMALHDRSIAEMRTGEGKTLSATLPVYLNALSGKGVHIVTVNDYLARRDARWMAPVYQFLGLSVGVLQSAARTDNGKSAYLVDFDVTSVKEDQDKLRLVPRREAYLADITYGTNAEFGFDYLRDNMTMRYDDRVQRGHSFALIDEVDNVLIDEARTPLIISGPASDDVEMYARMATIVRQLTPDEYEVSEKDHQVYINDAGLDRVEMMLGMVLRDPTRPEEITMQQEAVMGYLDQALKAQFLYHRNKEYLVQAGKVVIVDSFTGRLMPGRRWSNGLHQAIEAKEGVKIEPENITYATITLQNYYRMYDKICGMTGTALTEKEEFYKIYGLDVIPVPTNLEFSASRKGSELIEKEAKDAQGYKYTYYAYRDDPAAAVYFKRKDYLDVIYQNEEMKFRAITVEILENYIIGRPQLIGTASVEHSEYLASRLRPEPLRRLVQLHMLRRVWMRKNNVEYIEAPIKELLPFRGPIEKVTANELRPWARELGVSLNVDDPANKDVLLEEFNFAESDYERFLVTVESGITPQVLNARKHDEESMIIAHAGAFGAVTIATNMAGRGVDIKLGGELDEDVLRDVNRVLARTGIDPYNMTNDERYGAIQNCNAEEFGIYEESIQRFTSYIDDMYRVRALGGLHVIGSERHESRRIDNQLRGRAARQGDPGSSRFFLSLQDEIVRLFGGERVEGLLNRVNLVDESVPLEHGMFAKLVEQSQERVEGANFDARKHTLEYDDVLNGQRQRIYAQRDQAFLKADLSDDVYDMLETDLETRLKSNDEQPKWNLVAYLDSIQPPFEIEGTFIPSFMQKQLIAELERRLAASRFYETENNDARKETVADLVILIAREAFEAENKIALEQAEELIDSAYANFTAQLEERTANFELFVEALKDRISANEEARRDGDVVESLRGADLLTEAGGFARVNFRLSNEEQRLLTEADEDTLDKMRAQIESALMSVFFSRIQQSFAKRLGEDYAVIATSATDWEAFQDQALDAVSDGFLKRADRFFGGQELIRSDLTNAMKAMDFTDGTVTAKDWHEMLRAMSQGRVLAFDPRTHRKMSRTYTRINYVYLAGSFLEGLSLEQLTETVWNHYIDAMERLRAGFGQVDWNRLQVHNLTFDQLKDETQSAIRDVLGDERYAAIASLPLAEIDAETANDIKDYLGGRIQNEVSRNVILRAITDQWVDYLTQIEALRVSIGMEAYAQRNPLIVYKTKAAELFSELLKNIRRSVVERIFVTAPSLSMLTVNERVGIAELRKEQEELLAAAAKREMEAGETVESSETTAPDTAKRETDSTAPSKQVETVANVTAKRAESTGTGGGRKKKKRMKR